MILLLEILGATSKPAVWELSDGKIKYEEIFMISCWLIIEDPVIEEDFRFNREP